MKKIWIWAGSMLLVVILAGGGGAYLYVRHLKSIPSSDGVIKGTSLSHEEIVGLTKPAVVRVVQHVQGKVTFPAIKIDITTLTATPMPGAPAVDVPFDKYLTGSGFIIDEDGYIATNSHVVSNKTIKLALSGAYLQQVLVNELMYQMLSQNAEAIKKVEALTEEQGKDFAEKSLGYLLDNSKFEVDKKLVVLNPKSSGSDWKNLFNTGYQAKVISVNDNFSKDNRDVAVIKIEQTNLPTITLGNSDGISVGQKISIFGFPGSADFTGQNLSEATFTTGSVNALKDSNNKDFKIFQTDAKVSEGSSGGPMLNDNGQIIGLVTYESNESQRSAGDNFAFALPAAGINDWIKNFATSAYVPILKNSDQDTYRGHFLAGLQLAENNRCQRAIAEFDAVKKFNPAFSNGVNADPYIDKCKNVIASGKSIDTLFDEKMQEWQGSNKTMWIFGGIGLILILLIIGLIIFFMKKMRENRKEMDAIEENLSQHEADKTNMPGLGTSTGIMPAQTIQSAGGKITFN